MDFPELLRSIPQIGRVRWIGLRPAARQPLTVVHEVVVDEQQGLIGDRTEGGHGKKRQVTLIQFEHLQVMADILDRPQIDPGLLRRNIVVSGINLQSLKNMQFRIGTAVLMCTGDCDPCRRMEENLGAGGFNAMRGHGGITARVIRSGVIRVNDQVAIVEEADLAAESTSQIAAPANNKR